MANIDIANPVIPVLEGVLNLNDALDRLEPVNLDDFAGGQGLGSELEDAYEVLMSGFITSEDIQGRDPEDILEIIEKLQLVGRYKDLRLRAALEEGGQDADMAQLEKKLSDKDRLIAEHLSTIEDLDDEIEQLDKDLEENKLKIVELNRRLEAADKTTAGTTNAMIVDQRLAPLENEIERLRLDNSRLDDELDDTKKKLDDRDRTIKSLNEQLSDKQREFRALKDDLTSMRDMQGKQRGEWLRKDKTIDELRQHRETLQNENAQLLSNLETQGQELSQVQNDIVSLTDALKSAGEDFEEMKAALADSDSTIEELSRERSVLRAQVEELQVRLETKGDSDQALVDQINAKIQSWKKLLEQSEDEKRELTDEIDQLRAENARISHELENTDLDVLRKQINDRDTEIKQLRGDIEEQRGDMEVLGSKLLDQERNMAGEVDKAVGSKLQEIIDLKEEVEELREKLEAEKKRQTDVDSIIAEKEEELARVHKRMKEYEAGTYGLPEAVAELKAYKLQIHRHEQQIEKLTDELNLRLRQLSKLAYIVERLKEDSSVEIDEEDDIDVSELELRDQLEREQLKYQNRTLLKEIEALEEERAQLKARLRAAAWQRGVYAADRGMTGDEQWEMDEWRANKMMPGLEGEGGKRPVQVIQQVQAQPQAVSVSDTQPVASAVDAQIHQQLVALSSQVDKLLTEKEHWGEKESDYRNQIEEMSKELQVSKEDSDVQSRKLRQLLQGVSESTAGERRATSLNRIDALLSGWDGQTALTLEAVAVGELQHQLNNISKQMEEQSGSNVAVQNEMTGMRHALRTAKESLETKTGELEKANQMVIDLREALEARAASAAKPLPAPEEFLSGEVDALVVITSLNAQLVEALDELSNKERELFVLEGDIEAYGQRFRNVIDQRNLMVEEHLRIRTELEDKIEQQNASISSLRTQLESARVLDDEMEKLDSLMKLKENSNDSDGEDDVTRRIAEMVKKLTLLRVNENNLQRKLLNSADRDRSLSRENVELRSQAIRLEMMLKQRISELTQHETDALRRMRAMHEELRKSVPRDGLVKIQREYAALARRHAQTLVRERELVERNLKLEEISHQVDNAVAAQNEAQSAQAALEAKLKHLEASMKEMKGASGSETKLQALASDLSQQNARLKVAADHSASRAELALRAEKQAIQSRSEMNERLTQLEQDNIQLAMRAASLEEKAMSHAEALEDRISLEESKAQTKRIADMEEKVGHLESEVTKYRELTRLSSEQIVAVEAQRTQAEKKAEALQEGLNILQNASDESGRLGRLHHELVSLQIREAEATRMLEHVQQDQERLSTQHRQMESKLAENERALIDSREDMRTRVSALRVALEDLHLRHSGSQPLAKVELFTSTIRRSETARRKLQLDIEKMRGQIQNAEDKAWRAELEMEAERQIRVAVETGEAVQRLRQVMSQATDLKLAERRLQRRGTELQAKCDMLTELNSELEARIADMEAKAVEENATLDQQAFEYLGKLDAMERQLRDTRAERRAAADQQAMIGKDKAILARDIDPTLPVPKQLEAAIHHLGEFRELAQRYMNQCTEIAEKNIQLRDKLQESRESIMKRDLEINEMRMKSKSKDGSDGVNDNGKGGKSIGDIESDTLLAQQRAETQRLFKVAQQTITMMQGLLQRKEEAIVKYQEMLRTSRQQFDTERQRDKSQIESLVAQLSTASDVTIARLRSDMESTDSQVAAESAPKTEQLEEELSNTRDEMVKVRNEHALCQKDLNECRRALEAAREDLAACRSERQRQEAELGEAKLSNDKLRRKIERDRDGEEEEEEEVEKEERQPSPPPPPPPSPPSQHDGDDDNEPLTAAERREMARLRAELEYRSTEHEQLQVVVKKLRADLLECAEVKAERDSMVASVQGRVDRLVELKTGELQAREQDLENKLQKAKGKISDLQTDLDRVRVDMIEAEKKAKAVEDGRGQLNARVRRLERQVKESKENERRAKEQVEGIVANREATPYVRQLENRIRVLESRPAGSGAKPPPPSRLPRVPSQSSEAEQDINADDGATADTQEPAPGDLTTAQRWEAEKKLQRRVEVLRKKLLEKSSEHDALQKEVEGLKKRAESAEKDKEKLNNRVAELARAPRHAIVAAVEELESVASIQAERARLEDDNNGLRRVIEVDKAQELARLQRENTSLGERLESMESTVEDLRKAVSSPDGGNGSGNSGHDADRRELNQLRHKLTTLEEQYAELQETNIELRFDKETSALVIARLEKRVNELQRYREITSSVLAARGLGGRDKDSRELERVVESMKKVIEKLQAENESLRKTSASHVKYMELLKANRALKAELSSMKESEEDVREKATLYDDMSKKTATLSSEYEKVRRQLRKETAAASKLRNKVEDWERKFEKIEQERSGEDKRTRGAVSEVEREWKRKNQILSDAVAELDAKKQELENDLRRITNQNGELLSHLEKAKQELLEMKRRLMERDREGDGQGQSIGSQDLIKRINLLEHQLGETLEAKRRLEKELASFDPQFFEELSDLKYNYSQSVERVKVLEGKLDELGYDPNQ